jgi:nucleoside-diphosphate-sugar epimerase
MRPAFVFKRPAASAQRRLFAGPFLPGSLLKPGRLPVLPLPSDLRFQAVHSRDVGRALHRAITSDARGAFNLAAEPIINADLLRSLFNTRTIEVPHAAARIALAAAWHAHAVPVEPALLDLFLQLPLLDTTRARTELNWIPSASSVEALREVVEGLQTGAGGDTPPLERDSVGGRLHEVAAGVGERDR